MHELITDENVMKVKNNHNNEIGVHIRMGDFRKLNVGEEFKGGHVRTPESYFINIINGIRHLFGEDIKVNVFTDGYKNEFETIFNLKNIEMIEGNNDLIDMLLLSKSKIIVISTGSTFSYWAGFLSNAPMIMHPDHIHASIRNINKNDNIFEGSYDNAISSLKLMKDEKRND
jgi:hypothetical protein